MQETTTKSQELFGQLAGKTFETLTVWTEANQRVMRELINLSTTAAKETARLYGELQASAVEALRESQQYWLKRPAAGEMPSDPMAWYQKGLTETIESAQSAFRFLEGNAQAVTKTAEQLQTTAERTGKEIQEAFSTLANRMQQIYTAA
jgi:soluble cytochrome b562